MLSKLVSRNTSKLLQKSTTTTGVRPFSTNQDFVKLDYDKVCHNYGCLPVAIDRGERIYVWDVEGNKYFDFLCGYSACNQGHVHPKILKAMVDQAAKVTLTSRAFHNTQLGKFADYFTDLIGYDKLIPMNSGVEADETACKMARRWGYRVKGIPHNQANLLFPTGNFWGRSITASGACDDPSRYNDFGPFTAGFELFKYNDLEDLRIRLEKDPNIAGVCIEPIQGEGGVIIPHDGYLKGVRDLCTKHNVLMIADEIQTGFGRSGKMFAVDHEEVRPDILVMGKSMSGGMMPVSGCLADDFIMDEIKPGDHGSTYGGNPLAMAVAHAAVKTLVDEGMVENSAAMGALLKSELKKIDSPLFKEVRGRGLFVGVELKEDAHVDGNDYAKLCFKHGLLTKATHDSTIRLAPPLVITEDEVHQSLDIIRAATEDLHALNEQRGN